MQDDPIISRIKNGGQTELGMVYETYRDEFLRWIVKEFHFDTDDSKDIYQLTILIFYDNIKSGKLVHLASSIKTYLFGVGKNVAREHQRKARRKAPINQERWLRETLVDEPPEVTDDALFEIARKAVASLGQPCRTLVELFYYQRKSMEEISVQMNYKNADTAKNQKCKCMAKLRTMFEKERMENPVNQEL